MMMVVTMALTMAPTRTVKAMMSSAQRLMLNLAKLIGAKPMMVMSIRRIDDAHVATVIMIMSTLAMLIVIADGQVMQFVFSIAATVVKFVIKSFCHGHCPRPAREHGHAQDHHQHHEECNHRAPVEASAARDRAQDALQHVRAKPGRL